MFSLQCCREAQKSSHGFPLEYDLLSNCSSYNKYVKVGVSSVYSLNIDLHAIAGIFSKF